MYMMGYNKYPVRYHFLLNKLTSTLACRLGANLHLTSLFMCGYNGGALGKKKQENVPASIWLLLVSIILNVKEIENLKEFSDLRVDIVRMWVVQTTVAPDTIGVAVCITKLIVLL